MDVCRVASEKDTTFAVVACLPMMEPKVREPCRVAHTHATAGRSIDDGLQLRERELARERPLRRTRCVSRGCRRAARHSDHAPRRRLAQWKEHRNPVAANERMNRARCQRIAARCLGFDIAEHEVLQVRVAFEGDARALSHGAVRAVASTR